MSWFSTLLGTNGVVEGIKDGVDKAILTDEERLDYHKEMLKAYEPFKLIQRGLALGVTLMFSFILITQVGLTILGGWYPIATEVAAEVNQLESVSTIGYSFLAIMSLYFSGGVINSITKR